MEQILKGGLIPEAKDERDIKLGALITLPKLSELPESYVLEPLEVLDQGDTDFCSQFSCCAISSIQEGVVLDPLYSFAVSKMLSGDKDGWGQTVSWALKAHVKVGAINRLFAPFTIFDKDKVRDINNFPNKDDLYYKAIEHRKKSYVEITGPYDNFDNIRATLWKYRNEKRGAVMGLTWQWGFSDYVLKGTSKNGFGHMIAIIGWNKDGLILLNSAGNRVGLNGRHVLPREETNFFTKEYNGAFTFLDLSKDELREALEKGKMIDKKNLMSFIEILKNVVQLLTTIKKTLGEIVTELYSKTN